MPVEIRELIIKATVNQQQAEPTAQAYGDSVPGGRKDDRENLINQCVEQVLEILKNTKER